jgi:protein TonB
MANVGNGGGATAVRSTTPTATAVPQPTLVAARPLSRAAPRFPPRAQRDGVTGFVVVQIRVGAAGEVTDVRVVDSQPAGVFDDAAIESVRRWTFAPASADGAPLASWVRQTLRFQLEDT